MQIAEISFADKVAYNIKADDTKKYILDQLDKKYNLKIITKHYEKFNEKFMNTVNNNPHMLCARSNGNPYFLHMLKYNFTNYCIFIDKKIQQGYFYPRMIICNFHFDENIFDDTIFDGEMVKTKNGTWIFVINDLVVFKGSYMQDVNLIRRINTLYDSLDKDFVPDDMDICKLVVKRYFKYEEMDELLNKHIPKLPYTCRGMYFKPLFLRFKDILVNFNDDVIKKVDRKKYKNNFQLQGVNEVPKLEAPTIEGKQKLQTFNIRKTSNPDIYEIFDVNTNKPEGMAAIPSLKISKAMRLLFESKNVVDKIQINCEFSDKFQKWIPVVA